jgi:hypothetical protein
MYRQGERIVLNIAAKVPAPGELPQAQPGYTQGYIIMALGPVRYVEMAVNLAMSIRLMDPSRRICLIHDAPVPPQFAPYFHDFHALAPDPRYPNVMNKLRVFDATPYEQTMFIDADCLLVKHDVDEIWRRATARPFSITGDKQTDGVWKGMDVARMRAATGAPYIIRMCSGVFTFDRSAEATDFFRAVNELYLTKMDELGFADLRGVPGQTDEVYLGVAMGMRGMDAANMDNIGINSWSVSTWRSFWCYADFRGRCLMFKADGFLFGIPYLPTKAVPLSPTFMHFVGLKPRRLYLRLVRKIAAQYAARNGATPQ